MTPLSNTWCDAKCVAVPQESVAGEYTLSISDSFFPFLFSRKVRRGGGLGILGQWSSQPGLDRTVVSCQRVGVVFKRCSEEGRSAED